jgi:hypothetical protein
MRTLGWPGRNIRAFEVIAGYRARKVKIELPCPLESAEVSNQAISGVGDECWTDCRDPRLPERGKDRDGGLGSEVRGREVDPGESIDLNIDETGA